jgi:hypothetical protein
MKPELMKPILKKIETKDIVVALLIIGIAVLAYFNIESYEEEQTSSWSEEAFSQEFLAMKMHLENFEYQVTLADNTDLLFSQTALNPIFPEADDIIVLSQSEVTISKELSDKLLAWVDSGGHVILDLQSYEGVSVFSTNQFLKSLGVSTQYSEDSRIEDSNENLVTSVNTADFDEIEVNLYADIYIELDSGMGDVVYSAAPFEEYDKTQPTLVQLEYGKGLVTLMTDVLVWNNYQIEDNDNLLWLHQLAQGSDTLFVFSYRDPIMWYQVIARYSPAFYWILLVTILFFAWHNAIRFGAVVSLSHHIMTYFSQHIKAAGEFYWANNQQNKLIEEVRQQLKDELLTKLSRQNLSDEQIIEALGKISHWPAETLHHLLFEKNKLNESSFTKLMQGLQTLRKMI